MDFIIDNKKLCCDINQIMKYSNNDENLKKTVCFFGETISGAKPLTLINISNKNNIHSIENLRRSEKCIRRHSEIKLIFINKNNGKKQLLVYHKKSIERVINSYVVAKHLSEFGYPIGGTVEGYMDVLVSRLTGDEFPHEIGFFFGYPPKDVLGYMGIVDLPLVKTDGWKVYGNEVLSKRIKDGFIKAKEIVNDIVNTQSVEIDHIVI